MTSASHRLSVSLPADRDDELASAHIATLCEVSRGQLSVIRYDAASRKAVDYREWRFPYCVDNGRWAFAVRDLLASEGIVPTAAVVTDVRSSAMPSDLMPDTDSALRAMLHLEHGDLEDHDVLTAEAGQWDAVAVSLVPEAFGEILAGARLMPELAVLSAGPLRTAGQGARAAILMGERQFSIVITQDRSLLLYNSFGHCAPEDVLYFVLACLEQCGVPLSSVQVTVGGHVGNDGALLELLRRYLPGAALASRPSAIKYAYSFKELPAHCGLLLSGLASCV